MRPVYALLIAIPLAGCGATSYYKYSSSDGYRDAELGEALYQVEFVGNERTSPGTAADFGLLRSAELCLEKGFNFFTVIDSKQYQYVRSSAYYEGRSVYVVQCLKDRREGAVYNSKTVSDSMRKKHEL